MKGNEVRPVKAVVLSLVSGLSFLFVGLAVMPAQGGWLRLAISLMVTSGSLITLSAIFLHKYPKHHALWGTIILLSSPISLIAYAFRTYSPADTTIIVPVITIMIFMFIGMIGGALAITHAQEEKGRRHKLR